MSIKKGIYAASMSILNDDLSLDVDSTVIHAERLISDGCHGVVIFGSTGQAQLISSYVQHHVTSHCITAHYLLCVVL